jgi:hypothetical protein
MCKDAPLARLPVDLPTGDERMKRVFGYLVGLAFALAGIGILYRPSAQHALAPREVVPASTPFLAAGFQTQAVPAFSRELSGADAPGHTPLVLDPGQAVLHDTRLTLLIRTATLRLRVDSLGPALDRLQHVAQALDAIVATSDAHTGAGEHRVATVELRVASERFDRLVEGVRRLGSVDALSVNLEDAGSEYVDVSAHLANGRRLEARLLNILATRAGKLGDVILLERELANVRAETDALEGRRRYIENHAALSTLTVELAEPAALVGVAAPGVMRQAIEQSWDGFVWVVALLVRSVGVVVPLGLLALAGWALRRRFTPREA